MELGFLSALDSGFSSYFAKESFRQSVQTPVTSIDCKLLRATARCLLFASVCPAVSPWPMGDPQ